MVKDQRNFQPTTDSNPVNANTARNGKRLNAVEQSMYKQHVIGNITSGF